MRPRFMDQPCFWLRSARDSRSRAEWADPMYQWDDDRQAQRVFRVGNLAMLALAAVAAVLVYAGAI